MHHLDRSCILRITLSWERGTRQGGERRNCVADLEETALNDFGCASSLGIVTDGVFGKPPEDCLRRVAEIKQQHPLHLVAMVVGSVDEQARVFADKVITMGDLFIEREQLRDAMVEFDCI